MSTFDDEHQDDADLIRLLRDEALRWEADVEPLLPGRPTFDPEWFQALSMLRDGKEPCDWLVFRAPGGRSRGWCRRRRTGW